MNTESVTIDADMPGLAEASRQLDELIAADSKTPTNAQQAEGVSTPGSEEKGGDLAAAAPTGDAPKLDSEKPTDTPATADAPKDDKQPSRFEKAKARKDDSWEALNKQKDEHKAERDAFQKERDTFNAEKAQWQKQRDEAQAKYKPEDYEAAAERWEAEGKYDMADAARAQAKKLRENPPQTTQQVENNHDALAKQWWGKAMIDFPDVAKQGSAQHEALKQFLGSEAEIAQHPKGLYYAARLISSESAAARVPVMEKELSQLRAKVKELESLTAPAGDGAAARLSGERSFDQLTDAEQFAQLEREAGQVGMLR